MFTIGIKDLDRSLGGLPGGGLVQVLAPAPVAPQWFALAVLGNNTAPAAWVGKHAVALGPVFRQAGLAFPPFGFREPTHRLLDAVDLALRALNHEGCKLVVLDVGSYHGTEDAGSTFAHMMRLVDGIPSDALVLALDTGGKSLAEFSERQTGFSRPTTVLWSELAVRGIYLDPTGDVDIDSATERFRARVTYTDQPGFEVNFDTLHLSPSGFVS